MMQVSSDSAPWASPTYPGSVRVTACWHIIMLEHNKVRGPVLLGVVVTWLLMTIIVTGSVILVSATTTIGLPVGLATSFLDKVTVLDRDYRKR